MEKIYRIHRKLQTARVAAAFVRSFYPPHPIMHQCST